MSTTHYKQQDVSIEGLLKVEAIFLFHGVETVVVCLFNNQTILTCIYLERAVAGHTRHRVRQTIVFRVS